MNAANLNQTREALKALGFSIRFQHLRRFKAQEVPEHITIGFFKSLCTPEHALTPCDVYELDPRGGTTVCQIRTIEKEPQIVVEARIKVHRNDTYNKRVGRTKALGVALSMLQKRQRQLDEAGDA